MADTATDAAPAPPAPAAPPAVEQAPAGQRSTGGDLTNGRPAPRAITREDAGNILRQAYGRQKEMADQEGADAAARQAGEAPAEAPRPAQPVPDGRDAKGRFLPRQQAQAAPAVDTPPKPAVQEPPTQAPPRREAPARPRAPDKAPPAEPASAPPDAPPSPATPDRGTPSDEAAPPQDAPAAPGEDFKSARWLRAFQADPSLRRVVGRINADPQLSATRKAAQLAEKLADGEKAADAADWRAQQMVQLRRTNPQAYIQQVEADEAEAEAGNQLALRITQMIAEAYEVDPDDPDFLEAGPREGDDRVEGLRRFVEYTSSKSPVLKAAVTAAVEAQAAEHARAIEALKAQHKLDVEAALERGRSQARSPYGRNGAPPRSNGTGVVPVGQDEGPGGGPKVPAKAPTVAGIRDLIGMGYQQREAT